MLAEAARKALQLSCFALPYIKINIPLYIITNENIICLENNEEESILWNWQRL